jgi:hypothetical protein
MPKKSVNTVEGEVSYETVVCCSCGKEVAKEGATFVLTSTNEPEGKHFSGIDQHQYRFDGRPESAWLCQYCHENPVAYPHKKDKPFYVRAGRFFKKMMAPFLP